MPERLEFISFKIREYSQVFIISTSFQWYIKTVNIHLETAKVFVEIYSKFYFQAKVQNEPEISRQHYCLCESSTL